MFRAARSEIRRAGGNVHGGDDAHRIGAGRAFAAPLRGLPGLPLSGAHVAVLAQARRAAASGDRATAQALLRLCLTLNPAATEAKADLDALLAGEGAPVAHPDPSADALAHAGRLRALGRYAEALPLADAAVARDPGHYGARLLRGLIHDALGQGALALADIEAATERLPAAPEAYANLALIALGQRRESVAETVLERASAAWPDDAGVKAVLGLLRQGQGRADAALHSVEAALRLDPACMRAHLYRGGLLMQTGRLDEAADACRAAVRLAPGQDEPLLNLGAALRLAGRLDEARAATAAVLDRRPDHADALVAFCALKRQTCDWDGLADREAASLGAVAAGRRVSPFTLFAASGDPNVHRRAARLWAAGLERADAPLADHAPRTGAARRGPLRIGYLSNDFHAHATAALAVELFERHDRGRVAVFGYGYDADDGSAMRRRIVAGFDRFADIRGDTHHDAARRIRADGIDILVDLKGYLHEARTEIVAYRPAPIQVNFLGYPGTMGARFIDYIVADAVVVPPGAETLLDEKVVRLPASYQPNDRRRPLPDPALTRADCGLPRSGPVLCCLNAAYKIRPEIFSIWMRLLAAVPDAVLWLLDDNPWASGNLRRAAAARGIDPARLVFAPRLPMDRHLARLGLGDLFLDTLPVNAHTTASEALWAGMPVVTAPGAAFVSRVAASLLGAVGLPELAVSSLADYEALALALLRDPARLAALRGRLERGRDAAPLFDTPRFVRAFEAALEHMAARRDAGLPPASFTVEG